MHGQSFSQTVPQARGLFKSRKLGHFEAVIVDDKDALSASALASSPSLLWTRPSVGTRPWCPAASSYLGSVQPLQLLLLGLSPRCPLHPPRQLGTQLLLCVGSGLETGKRELLSQLPAGGGWFGWRAGKGLRRTGPYTGAATRQAAGQGG